MSNATCLAPSPSPTPPATQPPEPAAAPEVRELPVELIRTDGGTQLRAGGLDEEHARDLAEALDDVPPAVVFYDGQTYWLADGHHRHRGHQLDKRTHMRCVVHTGTIRDAVLYAAGCNAGHTALKRTRKDAERAVRAVLSDPEWAQWSDHTVAGMCRVCADTVGSVRRKMAAEDPGSVPPLDAPRKYRASGETRTMRPRGSGSNGKAKPPRGKAGEPPLLDALGRPVPERLRHVFASKFLADEAARLDQIAQGLGAQRNGVDQWLKTVGAAVALEEAREAILAAVPHCVCPHCAGAGEGCRTCLRTGYLNRLRYEELVEEGTVQEGGESPACDLDALRRAAVRLIASRGPQKLSTLLEYLDKLAPGLDLDRTVLECPWLEREPDGFHVTAKGRAEVLDRERDAG